MSTLKWYIPRQGTRDILSVQNCFLASSCYQKTPAGIAGATFYN